AAATQSMRSSSQIRIGTEKICVLCSQGFNCEHALGATEEKPARKQAGKPKSDAALRRCKLLAGERDIAAFGPLRRTRCLELISVFGAKRKYDRETVPRRESLPTPRVLTIR